MKFTDSPKIACTAPRMADGNFVVYVDVNTGKRQSRFGQQVGTEITAVCARAPPSAGAAAPGWPRASCGGECQRLGGCAARQRGPHVAELPQPGAVESDPPAALVCVRVGGFLCVLLFQLSRALTAYMNATPRPSRCSCLRAWATSLPRSPCACSSPWHYRVRTRALASP